MLTLELSREEAADLADALRSYLNDFHDEIVNTDDFDYKQALQRKRERLESVVARLGGSGAPGHAAGGAAPLVVDDGEIREIPRPLEGGAAY